MFESLFGAEMPLAVRFFLAFLIVLCLIGAAAWAVRRFGTGRVGGTGPRARQPRLAVIDYASVDGRRRLILVRRDNVEHLLMIGGPSDVVVETNIMRAVGAPREAAPRLPHPEQMPRAITLPEVATNGSRPRQPETAGPPRTAARMEPSPGEPARPQQPRGADTPARPQRETLVALADELSNRPPPLSRSRTATGRTQAAEPRLEPRVEPRKPMPQPGAEPAAAPPEENLAEMAHRLESVLRKPNAPVEARDGGATTVPQSAEPGAEQAPAADGRSEQAASSVPPPSEQIAAAEPAAVPPPSPRPTRPTERKMPRADPKQGQALYESLEQEMANLLGRPPGKG
ncbi:MAG TPA: flagellar biosynthesis protein FliO [Xanthobacteraceae bacterium]|jgi:hypothetical protein